MLVREIDRLHRFYGSVDKPISADAAHRLVGDLIISNRKLYRQAVFSTKQRVLSEQTVSSEYTPMSSENGLGLEVEFGAFLISTLGNRAKTFLDQFNDPNGSSSVRDSLIDFLAKEFHHMHRWGNEITDILTRIETLHAESNLPETTVDSTITNINDTIKKYLKCDRVSIWMIDQSRGEAWTRRQLEDGKTYQDLRIPSGAGLVGHCFTSRCSLNIVDAYCDERFDQRIDKATGYKTVSVLCVPIKRKTSADSEIVISVIQAINKTGGSFSKNDQLILSMFGAVASSVVIQCETQLVQSLKQRRTVTLMESLKLMAEDSLSRTKSPLEALLIIKTFLHKAFDAIDCAVFCPRTVSNSVTRFRVNEDSFALEKDIIETAATSLFSQIVNNNKITSTQYIAEKADFNIGVANGLYMHGIPVISRGICACIVEFVTISPNIDEQILNQFFHVSEKWMTLNFL